MSNDIDRLKERYEVLKDTYLSRAQADADMVGGRFKKQTETRVTGVPAYPPQPSNSPWHSDPVPSEEPLGYEINSLPDLGGASPALPCAETATPKCRGSSSTSPDDPLQLFLRRRL